MAVMFPSRLPKDILEDPKRSSEVKVYCALQKGLDNNYHVFYSSPWIGKSPDGREIEGEVDFIIAHAVYGVLAVEVKGGRVEVDEDNSWFSTDRNGFRHKIHNPFDQATKGKHRILGLLKETIKNIGYITVSHVVIFPDVVKPRHQLRPYAPLEICIFAADMPDLGNWIKKRYEDLLLTEHNCQNPNISPIGDEGIKTLTRLLTRKIVMKRANPLENLDEIRLKTLEQIQILEGFAENPRMAISGAAGTGKTILAIEKAIMMAEAGQRTLLLCYNRALSFWLREAVKNYPQIHAASFHQFCHEAGLAAMTNMDKVTPEQLAEQLVDNLGKTGIADYDAIIIDEGQDFHNDWLESLELAVKGGNEGVLYIFYDDNQNVMNSSSREYISRLPASKFKLTKNFRNTQEIFNCSNRFYKGYPVRSIGPLGTRPVYHKTQNPDDIKEILQLRLETLIKEENFKPGHIAVLCPDEAMIKRLVSSDMTRLAGYRYTGAENRNPELITVDTVRRFKGLESPVVILVLSHDLEEDNEIIYTGVSRAQVQLEVIAPLGIIKKMTSG